MECMYQLTLIETFKNGFMGMGVGRWLGGVVKQGRKGVLLSHG